MRCVDKFNLHHRYIGSLFTRPHSKCVSPTVKSSQAKEIDYNNYRLSCNDMTVECILVINNTQISYFDDLSNKHSYLMMFPFPSTLAIATV